MGQVRRRSRGNGVRIWRPRGIWSIGQKIPEVPCVQPVRTSRAASLCMMAINGACIRCTTRLICICRFCLLRLSRQGLSTRTHCFNGGLSNRSIAKVPPGTKDCIDCSTFRNVSAVSATALQGQRTLNSCDSRDLHQEVIIPAAELSFHGEAFFAGVLLQE